MQLNLPTLPAHEVIAGCDQIGFNNPLDRPWSELPLDWSETSADRHSCNCHTRYGRGQTGKCFLRVEVPLKAYRFITNEGEFRYHLGQCLRCLTIYWAAV